jgi:Tol biopolymer transport system component
VFTSSLWSRSSWDEILSRLGPGCLGLACLWAAAVGLLPATAVAALPGRNGSIAFGTADVTYLGSDEEADGISVFESGLVNANGRRRRIVARGADPAFSPRGRVLALARGGILVRPLDGAKVTRLTRGPDRFPTWSPAGRRLAFARELPGPHGYCEWTGSREVAYDSSDPCPARLYTVRRDGSDLRVLATRGWTPSWSSQDEIAYVGADGAIWASDGQGTKARRVVDNGHDPDWSPRGGRIAFVRHSGDRFGLFVVNRDGTGLRRLYVTGSHSLHSVAWSPGGRHIAFVKEGNGLYTLPLASGSRPTKLMGAWCPSCSEYETLYRLAWQPLPRSR